MTKELTKTINLTCPSCGGNSFELRVLADEGVACACCLGCRRDFLVLDSEDYWFDVIQASYPRLRKCSCKATSFTLKCDYFYRDDGDIKSVDLWSKCPFCEKTKRQMCIDIDYSDTGNLLNRPLRFCKTPNIRYDLKDISLYITQDNIASVIGYLHAKHQCIFIGWLLENGAWVRHVLDAQASQEAIFSNGYLKIYALPSPLQFSELEVATSKKEEAFWKRNEIIRISSPTHIRIGEEDALLYYIQYSNEWVQDDLVVQKQETFIETTKTLLEWLSMNFVSWRGKLCFDNENEHLRLFGNRFTKCLTSKRLP